MLFDRSWPFDQALQLACLLEASAPKLGNVHPGASFHDMHYAHFLASAVAMRAAFGPPENIDHGSDHSTPHSLAPGHCQAADGPRSATSQPAAATRQPWGVGSIVLAAAQAVRQQVGRNTHLGTLLLSAPLAVAHWQAAATRAKPKLQFRVRQVLAELSATDCSLVYEAIRLTKPGGLGRRENDDVSQPAPLDLLAAMQQVAQWDAVARQYINGFEDVFERLVPWLREEWSASPGQDPLQAICRLQIRWLAYEPDGLIVRKVGLSIAQQVQAKAQGVWQQLQAHHGTLAELPAAQDLDRFLRGDSNRRNPGTTADLIAAALLVVLLDADGLAIDAP